MKLDILLPLALFVATLGMAMVAVGVVSHAVFYPGIYLIAAGLIGVAVAGLLHITRGGQPR